MATAATIDVLLRANTATYRAAMIDAGRVANQNLGAIRKEAAQTAQSIQRLNAAAAGFIGFQAFKSGVGALIEAQKSIQAIHFGLQSATGSAANAERAYAFVAQTAKELGLNLQSAAKDFTRLSASASAANIPMADQQKLFTQLARSATALHLNQTEVTRATNALSQSFSKGKFQAEELRQQLSEAIPGAFARFQRAVLDMTKGTDLAGKSFDDLLQGGLLDVQRFLPAMVKALEETGSGAEAASKGLTAELNRLSTAWFNLKVDASSGLFSDVATTSVRLMTENLQALAGAATIAGAVLVSRLAGTGITAGIGAARGIAAGIAARKAETAAAVQATAAVVAKTRAELVEAEAVALRARAAYGGSIAADLAATTATKAHTAALREHTAAQAADAAAARAGTLGGLAGRAGAGALALVGGPVGAGILAIGALGIAYANMVREAEDARREFEAQVDALGLLKVSIDDVVDRYRKGSGSIKDMAQEWNTAGVAMRDAEERVKALRAAIENYQARIEQARTSTREGSGLSLAADIEGLQRAQDELAKFQAQVAPTRQKFIELEATLKQALDPQTFEAMRAAAIRADDVQFEKLLAGLSDVQRAAFNAAGAIAKINSAGADAVWSQQIELIRKTKGEYQAWLTEQGKAIVAAGGVNAMTKEAREQFNKNAAALRRFIDLNDQADKSRKASTASTRQATTAARQQENQLNSIVDRINQQIALDKEAMLVTDKMTAAQKLQVIVTEELKSAKNKLSDAEQARVRALLDEAVAQGSALKAMQDAKKGAEDLLRLQNQLTEAARSQQQSNLIDLMGIGRGGDAVEQMRRLLDLQREFQRQVEELNQRAASGDITQASYQEQFDALKAHHEAMLTLEDDYQQRRSEMQADWTNGARRALEDYIAASKDVASQVQEIWEEGFKTIEDIAVDGLSGNLKSWEDYFENLHQMILRFIVRQQLSKIAEKFLPGLLGGENGDQASALSSAAGQLAASASPLMAAAAALSSSAAALAAAGIGSASGSGGEDWGSLIDLFASDGFGFDKGGFTGPGGRLQVAGVVHKGEGVLSQPEIAAIGGESGFNALRVAIRRGYADGGFVGGSQKVQVGRARRLLEDEEFGGDVYSPTFNFLMPQRTDDRTQMHVAQAAGRASREAMRRNRG